MKKLLFSFLTFTAFATITSCNNHNNATGKEMDTTHSATVATTADKVYYRFPTATEIFEFIKPNDLKYKDKLTNSTSNLSKYIDTRAQTFNYGVYSTDVAYMLIFKKYQEAQQQFAAVKELTGKIGIDAVFSDQVIKRLNDNYQNMDSVLAISDETYINLTEFLESAGNESTLAIISIGSWVEALYLAVNMVDKYSPDHHIIKRIADQKPAFNNLVLYAESYNDNQAVSSMIPALKKIDAVFNGFDTKVQTSQVKTANDGKIIVGGNNHVSISEAQFEQLRTVVAEVRQQMVDAK